MEEYNDFEYKESGVAGALLDVVLVVIVIGVAAMIGISVMTSTYSTTSANVGQLPTAVGTDANAAIAGTFTAVKTTVTNTNTVVIALMGAIAIGAILGFMAFGRNKGGSSGSGTM